MEQKIYNIMIRLANKAYNNGDIPVGAIVVKEGKIISQAYNKKEYKKNAINHAEIIAIDKACRKLKTWHLEECEIFVTLEPCLMCIGAISQARIGKLTYILENSKFGFTNYINVNENITNHKIEIVKSDYSEELANLMKKFFENKRN